MIPFTSTDPRYLKELEGAANDVRKACKSLKLLILTAEGEQSPASAFAAEQHRQWKALCSLTSKAIKAAKNGGAR